MPNKCYVPYCKTGYKRRKNDEEDSKILTKKPILFKAPTDPERLQEWHRKIHREDKILTSKDFVCELHFIPDYISRYNEHKLPDGTIQRIEKNPTLSPKAVPTILPGAPSYLTDATKKSRKSPRKRPIDVVQKATSVRENCSKKLRLSDDVILSESIDSITFNKLWTYMVSKSSNNWIDKWLISKTPAGDTILLIQISDDCSKKKISIDTELNITVFLCDVKIKIEKFDRISTANDLQKLIDIVNGIKTCLSFEIPVQEGNPKIKCMGFIPFKSRSKYCTNCCERRKLINRQKHRLNYKLNRRQRTLFSEKRKVSYYRKKVADARASMRELTQKLANTSSQSVLKEELAKLPETTQQTVLACIQAANCKKRGIRYTRAFIFECILLRIKSRSTYEQLRRRQVLTLPSLTTIRRYTKNLKASFGFQKSLFTIIKEKTKHMDPKDRRGCLLLDEMGLSQGLKVDKSQLKIIGFTDLGKYTAEKQKAKLGDHALVVMFQPFRGNWIQALGSFLSCGCADGQTLVQIIMEAVILCENAGLFVDTVTTDGAQWNRGMWRQFGITKEQTACEHFVDNSRSLWFSSDFPHLIKCLWMWLLNQDEFQTTDGIVKKKHWEMLLKVDNRSLRASFQLTDSHLKPDKFQKMNVARAYQMFSPYISSAMRLYKDKVPELADCEPTCLFIDRIHKLIMAFNSRSSKGAIFKNSTEKEVIRDFLQYLKNNTNLFTKPTWTGLIVSCVTALEVSNYLIENCSYTFVMLTRLNQDNLERFFGMIRAANGHNDHPSPYIFLITFKLMCLFSLVKPPKGCNVTGAELLQSLCKADDVDSSSNSREEWKAIVKQSIVAESDEDHDLNNLCQIFDFDMNDFGETSPFPEEDTKILEYGIGALIRRVLKIVKNCGNCLKILVGQKKDGSLIALRDYYNVLIAPSSIVSSFIQLIEDCISLETNKGATLHPDIFHAIGERVSKLQLPQLGCNEHAEAVTEYCLESYIICRIFQICNDVQNKLVSEKKKFLSKAAKVYSTTKKNVL